MWWDNPCVLTLVNLMFISSIFIWIINPIFIWWKVNYKGIINVCFSNIIINKNLFAVLDFNNWPWCDYCLMLVLCVSIALISYLLASHKLQVKYQVIDPQVKYQVNGNHQICLMWSLHWTCCWLCHRCFFNRCLPCLVIIRFG